MKHRFPHLGLWFLACVGCWNHDQPPAAPPPLTRRAPIPIRLDTELGTVRCTLFPERAPQAAALLIGLAAGTVAYRDPQDGRVKRGRFYDGLPFFRRTPGVLVQVGCPFGNGTGHPGFRIPAEHHPKDQELLRQAGALVMARYHPPPNRADPHPPPTSQVIGSQFAIALRPMLHLEGSVPVLGRCVDLDVVRALSQAHKRPYLRRLRAPRLP